MAPEKKTFKEVIDLKKKEEIENRREREAQEWQKKKDRVQEQSNAFQAALTRLSASIESKKNDPNNEERYKILQSLVKQSKIIVANTVSNVPWHGVDDACKRVDELTKILVWADDSINERPNINNEIIHIIEQEMGRENWTNSKAFHVAGGIVIIVLGIMTAALAGLTMALLIAASTLASAKIISGIAGLLAGVWGLGCSVVGKQLICSDRNNVGREVRHLSTFFVPIEADNKVESSDDDCDESAQPAVV